MLPSFGGLMELLGVDVTQGQVGSGFIRVRGNHSFELVQGIGNIAALLERQREGIAKTKAEKIYKRRQKTAQRHKDTILKLHNEGLGVAAILKQILTNSTVVSC